MLHWLNNFWLDLIAQPKTLDEIIWLYRYCGSNQDWANRRWSLKYWREHYGSEARLSIGHLN